MKKLTQSEFLERAKSVHGGAYDYSGVVYSSMAGSVSIGCREHGIFTQTAGNHLAGKGCAKCGRSAVEASRRLTPAQFVERANEAHGGALDFSESAYTKWDERVRVTCPEHGAFMALPAVVLRGGSGCPKCHAAAKGPARLTSEEFIANAKSVHGERYDYSKVQYVTFLANVEIVCKDHGPFLQSACNHTAGKGCPKCSGSQSKPEIEILEWVRAKLPGAEVLERTRGVIAPFELDIFVPSKKVAIEFNGLFWHASDEKSDSESKRRHSEKLARCDAQGIRLIQVREDRWEANKDACLSLVASALGFSDRAVGARSCRVVEVEKGKARAFFGANHADGFVRSPICYGLELDGQIVSAMSFGRPRYSSGHDWELLRFASAGFTSVAGAAGKLMAHFRSKHAGSVVSYCNLEYSNGGVYRAIGMSPIRRSAPSYIWVKNGQKAFSRYQTQKHKLPELLKNFDAAKSESANMFANGMRRYWDSGNLVFELA